MTTPTPTTPEPEVEPERDAAERVAWTLDGKPPAPQDVRKVEAPAVDDLRVGDTHTGTDPLGRAIGPAESHLATKRVRDDKGEIVTPKMPKGQSATAQEARARKIAEATGTVPEAVDDPTPLTPAEVASLHKSGA